MTQPDIHRLVELQKLLVQFQNIERHVCYANNASERPENDAEHSYSLAIAAWFLAQYFTELDTDEVIRIALAHDLVEIHAGDTSVFADEQTLSGKSKREASALDKLANEWRDFPELITAMRTYKERTSNEASFVYALDKLMPVILNYTQEGRGWRKHGVTIDKAHEVKKDKLKAHPEIHKYYLQLFELLKQKPHFFAPAQP